MTVQLAISDKKTSIILTSGGLGSFCAGWLELQRVGLENCIFYFNDTLVEDADLYRFLVEHICFFHGKKVNKQLKTLIKSIPDLEQEEARKAHLLTLGHTLDSYCSQFHYDPDGRNVFEVFHDNRYLGNSRIDPCSRVLKRERSRAFVEQFTPDQVDVIVGMDWSEIHRIEKAIPNWLPYTLRSPMIPTSDEDETWTPRELVESYILKLSGIKKPGLYGDGFQHNNCAGFCIKAGLGHFKLLWEKRPKVYAYFERKEEELHRDIPTTLPFLRKSGKGAEPLALVPGVRSYRNDKGVMVVYLTLKQYRELILEPQQPLTFEEQYDFGGCACAL